MAKCLRCGRELSRPKCECGFDVCEGVCLLTELEETYIVSDRARKEALAALTRVLGAVAEKKDYDEAALELAEAMLRLVKKLDLLNQMSEPTEQESIVGEARVVEEVNATDPEGIGEVDADGILRIREGVTEIKESAFWGREDLREVYFPDSVTTLGGYAFRNCTSLRKVRLSNRLDEIPEHAFCSCSKLWDIMIPESVTIIDETAFYGCKSLPALKLPNTMEIAGGFNGCTSLEEMWIPDGVTTLPSFFNCTSLRQISLPGSIRYVPMNALGGCSSLNNIVFRGNKKQWKAIEWGYKGDKLKCMFKVKFAG
ncbi:MAG: leucine-rich repeat protein [Lachnospiraceae bacterium]|nr:leucine-rich repeat protein [Lachnospiraceae bacterium]